MIIDKEQLISLLIEKTGLDHEQVKNQLSELTNRIQEAADEGKTFEIEGFGTFDMQDGNLQFEPSDTLETEINNKYAGMKPIELIGAFKEPEGDEIPDMTEESEEDKVWAFDEEAAEEESPAPEVSEAESKEAETEEESPAPEVSEVEEVAEDEVEDKAEKETAATEEMDSDKIFEEIFGSKKQEAQTAKSEQDEQRGSEPADPTSVEKAGKEVVAEDEQQDTIGRLLVAAVVVIALGVAGWLVYDSGILAGGSDGSSQITSGQPQQQIPAQQTKDTQTGPPQDEETQLQQTNEAVDNKSSEPEQPKEVVKEGGSQAASEAEQKSTYGLRGTVNESISSSYTIVVHSLRGKQKAENRRQNLAEAGFRALISEANVQGTTYYRVGIGQFKTVDAAQQAVSEIPESFRDSQNHFIKRIR